MKFYGSNHPSNPFYPSEQRRLNENEAVRKKIARVRELAAKETDPTKSPQLYAVADALAQKDLPISKPKPRPKQRRPFGEGLD